MHCEITLYNKCIIITAIIISLYMLIWQITVLLAIQQCLLEFVND